MCTLLQLNYKKVITRKDKIVYKLLHIDKDKNTISIYERFPYKKGILYESEILIHDDGNCIPNVTKGIHSFESLEYIKSKKYEHEHIGEFTIPKGSKTYIGTFFSENDTIVSNKIIFNRIIIEEEYKWII